MCVVRPLRIVSVSNAERKAVVELPSGETTIADLSLVEAKPGDYVVVNNGFIIQVLPSEEAQATLKLWEKLDQMMGI